MKRMSLLVLLAVSLLAACEMFQEGKSSPALPTVTITVTDGTNPIWEASVTINGVTKETDTNGIASFKVKNDTYSVDISALGYEDSNQSITTEGSNHSENLALTEKTYTYGYTNYTLANGDSLLGNQNYHAMSYGGYRTTTRTDTPTVDQLKEDMLILSAMGVKLIRTYNTQDFGETPVLLQAIDELNNDASYPDFEMYVMLGAWIGCEGAYTASVDHEVENLAMNTAEIDTAISLASAYPDIVKIIAVGNEAMVHWQAHFVRPRVILKWVNYLRDAREIGDIPVDTLITSSDNFASWGGESGYHHYNLVKLINAVDFISLHTYPFHDTYYNSDFWYVPEAEEDLEYLGKIDNAMVRAVDHSVSQYNSVAIYVSGIDASKELHIGETGWATSDSSMYANTETGTRAADEYKEKLYYDGIRAWTDANSVSCFYFEAFNEQWKTSGDPSGSENHFGLFTVDGQAKYALWDLVDAGTFTGLTRDGNPIVKTYSGNESTLLAEILPPLNLSALPVTQIDTTNDSRDAGTTVTETSYILLNSSMVPDGSNDMTYPSDTISLNIWDGTCGISLVSGEIVVETGTGSWWGCGLEIQGGTGEDMTNFGNGTLHFDIKGTTNSTFDIGFQTGLYNSITRPQVNNSITFGPTASYSLTSSYVSYSIPMSELIEASADLSDVTSLLYLLGGDSSTFDGETITINNVYWTQN